MTEFRLVADGLRFPEGPIAMPDGSIIVVEIEGGCLTRVTAGGRCVVAELGDGPNGAAIGPDGKCYVCNNGGFKWHREDGYVRPVGQAEDYSGGRIERVDLDSGDAEVLYRACGGHSLKGPNDIVFDELGGFYFTDLGKARERESDRGGLYYAKTDGSLIEEIVFPLVTPNGVGLSPDGRRLYVAETEPGRLWVWEVRAPGELAMRPWPSPNGGALVSGLPGYQRLDSMALEANGNICVATLNHGGITVISAAGEHLGHTPLPDAYCTNICFGGADLRTAYVTLSGSGRLIAMDWPRPGLDLHFVDRPAAAL